MFSLSFILLVVSHSETIIINITLVEAAGKLNIENTQSTHGEILWDYNAASTISIKTENIFTSSPPRSFCFPA